MNRNNANEKQLNVQLLGDALILDNLITQKQLDETIEHQCIHGGRLGTNLLELGFINEKQLTRALCRQHKAPFVSPKAVMNIPASLLKTIPAKTALKYKVLPLREDGKKLYLAMITTSDLQLIDDLSFQLDRIITPLIVPEIRMLLALNKHFGMPLPSRYESLAIKLHQNRQAAPRKPSAADEPASLPPEATPAKAEAEDMSSSAWPLLGEVEYPPEEYGGNNAEAETGVDAAAPDYEKLLESLTSAKNRTDIADAALKFLAGDFPRCALLTKKDQFLTGWHSSNEADNENFAHLSIDLAGETAFRQPLETGTHYLGPISATQEDVKILDFFKTQAPQTAMIAPLQLKGRQVAVLYIQGNLNLIEERFSTILKLVYKLELAMQLLIFKNKILAG